jgi:hypothetical protein
MQSSNSSTFLFNLSIRPLRYPIFSSMPDRYCSYYCLTASSCEMYSITTWWWFKCSHCLLLWAYIILASISLSLYLNSAYFLFDSSHLLSNSLKLSCSLRVSETRYFSSPSLNLSCCFILLNSSDFSLLSALSFSITASKEVPCFSANTLAVFYV